MADIFLALALGSEDEGSRWRFGEGEIHILADVCNAQVSDTKRVNLLDNNVSWILVFENVDKKIVLIQEIIKNT
jgi:hypothetical protein